MRNSTNGMDEQQNCPQCAEYLAGWKRALADYDNVKKEMGREREQMRQSAASGTAAVLIPVLDHFDQAVKFTPEGLDAKANGWLQGILHVRSQLEDVLKGLGLEPFGSAGEPFDPNQHEAVSQRHEEGTPPDTVLDIVQRGWKLGDHVVKPAKVIVNQ